MLPWQPAPLSPSVANWLSSSTAPVAFVSLTRDTMLNVGLLQAIVRVCLGVTVCLCAT